jgi:hypothetical protein
MWSVLIALASMADAPSARRPYSNFCAFAPPILIRDPGCGAMEVCRWNTLRQK